MILIKRKSHKLLTKCPGIQNRKSKEKEGRCSPSLTDYSIYGNDFSSCSHDVLQRHADYAVIIVFASCSHKLLQRHADSISPSLCDIEAMEVQILVNVSVITVKWLEMEPPCGYMPCTAEVIKSAIVYFTEKLNSLVFKIHPWEYLSPSKSWV